MEVPTVKIASPDGKDYIVINAEDYDEKKHKLIKEEASTKDEAKPEIPFEIDPIEDARRSAIVIPEKIEALSAGDAKALAQDITKPEEKTFATKAEALEAINAEVDRRLNK